MVLNRTYGSIQYNNQIRAWQITDAEPHVWIRLKGLFPGISINAKSCNFPDTAAKANDLYWFMSRYPMRISDADRRRMNKRKREFIANVNSIERILLPDYIPTPVTLNEGEQARNYQLIFRDMLSIEKRILLGDDIGTGKTLSGILGFTLPDALPAAVVCQAHLPAQWKAQIERFTNLKVHIIKNNKGYNLTGKNKADVYIFKYSSLTGWAGIFRSGFFRYAVFDEVQELRRWQSAKYGAAEALAHNVDYCTGMSATPIYNYGDEIYNIAEIVRPGCLGSREDFIREYCIWLGGEKYKVVDPNALGSFLREQHIMLRRTREDVKRELPPLNKIVHTVPFDEDIADQAEELATELALRTVSGNFMESGEAAREFDALLRHTTGIAKARGVAAYIRMFMEQNEPVILAGWHRKVYEIWAEELKEYNPVFYTGEESASQKKRSVDAFINGETNLFIISLRSGIGLDSLQYRCKTIVLGELDWSPKVHEQVIGRIHRDGNENQVTAIFLVCDNGSDPVITNILGLKASQSYGIMNPNDTILASNHTDESRIKTMATAFLKERNITDF